jgi:ABC-type multidrug transport system fused ATPase/permease subunit
VVVLEHGSIVQEGPHSELIKTHGPYRKLCKEQFGSVSAHELNKKAG